MITRWIHNRTAKLVMHRAGALKPLGVRGWRKIVCRRATGVWGVVPPDSQLLPGGVVGLRHVCFFSKPPAYIPPYKSRGLQDCILATCSSSKALVPKPTWGSVHRSFRSLAMVPSIGKWKRRPMFGCQVWMPKSLKLTSRPMPFCMFMVGCTPTWTRGSVVGRPLLVVQPIQRYFCCGWMRLVDVLTDISNMILLAIDTSWNETSPCSRWYSHTVLIPWGNQTWFAGEFLIVRCFSHKILPLLRRFSSLPRLMKPEGILLWCSVAPWWNHFSGPTAPHFQPGYLSMVSQHIATSLNSLQTSLNGFYALLVGYLYQPISMLLAAAS